MVDKNGENTVTHHCVRAWFCLGLGLGLALCRRVGTINVEFRQFRPTSSFFQTTSIDISNDRSFDFDVLTATVKRSSKTLTAVNLSRSRDVTDFIVYQFAVKCRQITDVDLSYCPLLTNVGLRILANLVSLERIDISGCPKITGRGVHLMIK